MRFTTSSSPWSASPSERFTRKVPPDALHGTMLESRQDVAYVSSVIETFACPGRFDTSVTGTPSARERWRACAGGHARRSSARQPAPRWSRSSAGRFLDSRYAHCPCRTPNRCPARTLRPCGGTPVGPCVKRSAATVGGVNVNRRFAAFDFGSWMTGRAFSPFLPAKITTLCRTQSVDRSRSMSSQRRPRASPCRSPVVTMTSQNGPRVSS